MRFVESYAFLWKFMQCLFMRFLLGFMHFLSEICAFSIEFHVFSIEFHGFSMCSMQFNAGFY